jgi:Rieske Fe-S protein
MTACPADGAVDIGAPTAFKIAMPTFIESVNAFIIRDSVGLYAVSATCTHQRCTIYLAAGGFACPCHGAKFTLGGNVTVGPATRSLTHFEMCILPSGNVGVIPTMAVPSSQRLAV